MNTTLSESHIHPSNILVYNFWKPTSLKMFLQKHNPVFSDEELYRHARLVTSAVIAKVHTIDWSVELLKTNTLLAGMRTNWYVSQYIIRSLPVYMELNSEEFKQNGWNGWNWRKVKVHKLLSNDLAPLGEWLISDHPWRWCLIYIFILYSYPFTSSTFLRRIPF